MPRKTEDTKKEKKKIEKENEKKVVSKAKKVSDKNNDAVTLLTLIKLVATLIFGGIGGILGLQKKERIHIK